MAVAACGLNGSFRKFKPHIFIVIVQFCYTFMYFITDASFKHGMKPHVYVTYRHILAGLMMLPFAYFLERNKRPKLTIALLLEIFILSLLGICLTLNMYFASLRYTSPAFVTPIFNTVPCLTFVIAVILRLEVVHIRDPRGLAKVLGTLISLGGVMTMTLYKGPILRNTKQTSIHFAGDKHIHENWVKGSVLAVISCITRSMWFIMQAYTLKRYPAQLSLSTWMCFFGALQSGVLSAIIVPRQDSWVIGFNVDLWSTIYGAVVASGFVVFIQLWCTKEKGPVFVTMFSPLGTILVVVVAYFLLHEKLYTGSVVGAVIVIVGLYVLLWGKEDDQNVQVKPLEKPNVTYDDEEAHKVRSSTAATKISNENL